MRPNLFNLDNFPAVGNENVTEHNSPNKVKTERSLYSTDVCDGFFETLQGRLKELEISKNIDISGVIKDLPKCNLVLKESNLLGEYISKRQHIEYYKQDPAILKVTRIHERFHAVHHLTLDNNGANWEEFPKVSPFYKELLAQLFTWIYINDYHQELIPMFNDLNQRQPLIYQIYKIFQHYDSQQAEDLYWNVRNMKFNANNNIIRCLGTLSNLFILKNTSVMSTKKIVPSTKLRALYESLTSLHLSTETQKCIMQDLLRKDNHKGLANLFDESYKHITTYNNKNEPIINLNAKRKPILGTTLLKSTNDVISLFLSNNKKVCVAPSMYDFEYIEREVSPLRTTNAIYENQLSAKRSGTGGLDFIGWNASKNLPVLGEIKVKGDQNPFYALIQLLTYLSEISTPNQIDRINNYKHFGTANSLSSNAKFYLYIISCRQVNLDKKYDQLLPSAKALAKNIGTQIAQIEDIIFFHLDLNTKVITQE